MRGLPLASQELADTIRSLDPICSMNLRYLLERMWESANEERMSKIRAITLLSSFCVFLVHSPVVNN